MAVIFRRTTGPPRTGLRPWVGETPVDVQTRDGRQANHHAYLWQYGTPGGAAIFEFRMGRGRDGSLRFLGDFEGILQTESPAKLLKVLD